jgi:ribosome modulation factor
MARKPKLAVVGGPGAAPAGKDHNGFDETKAKALHLSNHVPAYEKALKAKKDADANFKNVCKTIKSEGGSIDDIKLTIKLRTPEGEKEFEEDLKRQLRVADWNNLAIGQQGNLFGPDRQTLEEKAFKEGEKAGLEGKDAKPPYSAENPGFQQWMEGWHKSQKILAAGFKPTTPKADVIKNPENKTSAPDEFDDAAGASGAGQEGGKPWPDDQQAGKVH